MVFIYVFTLLSISNSLFVISLSALRVGELGKRSINDFPSSNDCARLGSSGMEPKIKIKIKQKYNDQQVKKTA